MNEIKFRVWDNILNKMQLVKQLDFKRTGIIVHTKNSGGYADYNKFIMQFTGLKDKNGKEIYEGDVIRCFQFIHYSNDKEEKIKCVVFYDNAFVFKCMDGTGYDKLNGDGYEIIGNIYENPELLNDVKSAEGEKE